MRTNITKWLAAILLLCLPLQTFAIRNKCSKQLSNLLERFLNEEEIHPDSIFPNIRQMEARLAATNDPTERAVTWAVLGYLYISRNSYAQSRTSRVERDSLASLQHMDEWSSADFNHRGAYCFQQALSDLSLLGNTRRSKWCPLLKKGKDDKIFNSDMLYPIWTTARDIARSSIQRLPSYATLIAYYKDRGNRKAALRLSLDSLDTSYGDAKTEALKRLKDEYADQPMCAEVYLQLANRTPDNSHKITLLKEAIKRYSKYKNIGALDNALHTLLQPKFQVLNSNLLSEKRYPGDRIILKARMNNVQQLTYSLYHLPLTVNIDSLKKLDTKSRIAYINQIGKKIDTTKRSYQTDGSEEKSYTDSIAVTIPDVGFYMVVLEGTTTWKYALNKQITEFIPLSCTRLAIASAHMPGAKTRLIVTDQMTGQPIEDAQITIYSQRYSKNPKNILTNLRTDKRGIAETDYNSGDDNMYYTYANVSLHGDTLYPDVSVNLRAERNTYNEETDNETTLNIYTDRSIYRPGQTIHVSGLLSHRHVWNETILAGKTFNIQIYDVNDKSIDKKKVTTDEMGTFTTDFVIPQNTLTGTFTISAKDATHYIQVEEYKRPTFEVEMDDVPPLQLPSDSITLTGQAKTYAGVPVRGGRVTGSYRWTRPYWCWYWRHTDYSSDNAQQIDTLTTDDEGRFSIRIPLTSKTDLSYGMNLEANVDVLSPNGETQSGSTYAHLCSKSLRLSVSIPHMNDKSNLKPWSIELITSTGKPIDGMVSIRLLQENKMVDGKKTTKAIHEYNAQASKEMTPKDLVGIPSGRYQLVIKAALNGDSAEWRQQIVLFDIRDNSLPVDTALWVYTPSTIVTPDRPAQIQIGSSLKDAYVYCLVTSSDSIIRDEAPLHLSTNGTLTLTIPYKDSYKRSFTANVYVQHGGTSYSQNLTFLLQKPDKELKHKWVTFRDKSQPGAKETWQLQLTCPDGTPADAQLMATIYDASLNALVPNDWYISHTLDYYILNHYYNTLRGGMPYINSFTTFGMTSRKTYTYTFSTLNEDLFYKRYTYDAKRRRKTNKAMLLGSGSALNGIRPQALFMAETTKLYKNVNQSDNAAPTQKSERLYADANKSVDEEEARDNESQSADDTMSNIKMRSDFSETAAFLPQLRSNKDGIVTLEFTLPESMTTWRLKALAHTSDMLTTIVGKDIIAQKDLMAQLSLPRFVRSGDKATLVASINNITDHALKGKGQLTVVDAQSEKQISIRKIDFNIAARRDTIFRIPLDVNDGHDMLIVRWVADAGTCNDGEQRYLPVLSDKEMITTSRPLTYYGKGTYTENLSKLFPTTSDKAGAHKRLTIEYVTNPVWCAIDALPAMAWPERNDVLSLLTAYYAGSISKSVCADLDAEHFKNNEMTPSFMKKLEESELTETTPWYEEAKREVKRRSRLTSLLDPATQSSLQKAYLDKLRGLQQSDGSFSWYPKMAGSHYLTLEVAYLLTRQKMLTGEAPNDLLSGAVKYLRTIHPTSLCNTSLRYLYVISANRDGMSKEDRHNADSLLKALNKVKINEKKWRVESEIWTGYTPWDVEECALAAIVLHRNNRDKAARKYLDIVKHYLVTTNDKGTYIEHSRGAYTSIDRRLNIHVQIMEALAEVCPEDSSLISGMQRYLLQQKRTQDWQDPITTANAVYALLRCNEDLSQQKADDVIRFTMSDGKTKAATSDDATTGYIRQSFDNQIESNQPGSTQIPTKMTIAKQGKGESWGAVYAQYEIPMDEVKADSAGLTVSRGYYLLNTTSYDTYHKLSVADTTKLDASTTIHVGDRIHARYVVTTDRDYEYVALRVPRPATCEPAQQLSGYNWQNGIGYYRSVRDASSEYYFDSLPRGTYVIEEELFVERPGDYNAGIATVKCLYAPEFSAHSSNTHIIAAPQK